MKNTLILGASCNSSRYSNKAMHLLNDYDHQTYCLGAHETQCRKFKISNRWPQNENFHTVSIYLNAINQEMYYDLLLQLKPNRVIFNPGSENETLYALLSNEAIYYIEACTLVMLRTGVY
ncbi:MAG TPA: CoA-binding protein [Bacteroidia bacterium]|nr:CoA-binding protein [Bacteroidia bacterium]HNT80162.1 CoA-binding protein [Bacteroidia bacterium]